MPPVGWKRANGVSAAALELSRFVESGSVRLTRRLITFTALSLRSQTRLGHQRWAIGVPARTAKGFLIPGVQQSKCRDIKEMSCPFARESSLATSMVQRNIRRFGKNSPKPCRHPKNKPATDPPVRRTNGRFVGNLS